MRYAINLWHQAVARGIRGRQREGKKNTHNNNNRRQTSDIAKGVEGRRKEEETVYVCAVGWVWFRSDRFVARLKLIYKPFKDQRVRLSCDFCFLN